MALKLKALPWGLSWHRVDACRLPDAAPGTQAQAGYKGLAPTPGQLSMFEQMLSSQDCLREGLITLQPLTGCGWSLCPVQGSF